MLHFEAKSRASDAASAGWWCACSTVSLTDKEIEQVKLIATKTAF